MQKAARKPHAFSGLPDGDRMTQRTDTIPVIEKTRILCYS